MCQSIWLQKIFTTTSGLYPLSLYWYDSMHWALYCRISNVPWSVPQYLMLSVLQGAHKIFYWLFLHTPTVHIFQHHIHVLQAETSTFWSCPVREYLCFGCESQRTVTPCRYTKQNKRANCWSCFPSWRWN